MRTHWQKVVFGLTVVVVVGLGWGATALPRVAADLPPRPPTPTPSSPATSGGPEVTASVALRAAFPDDWPWAEVGWQDVWTRVEWQDPEGEWHAVAGWQGTLDAVSMDDGTVIGHKTWWVDEADLGTGPFRWVVLDQEETVLGMSEPFSLPALRKGTTAVEVGLDGAR